MVGIHYWPEHHWMSLDVIGRWWLALSRKHGQGTTSQKTPPKSTSSAITSSGAPQNPRNQFGSRQPASLQPISLILPSYILATLDGAQNVLSGRSQYIHRQTVTLLCYSVQSNTCAGMTSDASSVICSVTLARNGSKGYLIMLQKTDWNWIFQISFCVSDGSGCPLNR